MIRTILTAFMILATLSFTTTKKEIKKVDVSKSTVNWVGKKITGQHNGTIKIKKGTLEFKDKKLVGGSFVVDMTSILVLDLKGKYKKKLEKHLKADDFFGVKNFKTSSLVITEVKNDNRNYSVTGDLTIKGITRSISFKLNVYENTADASLKIDRTKFGIKYGSSSFYDNLKDKAINDEFELQVSLKF